MPGSQFELVCEKARIEVSDRELTVIHGMGHSEWARATLPIDDYMYTYQLAAVAELIQVLEQGGSLISPAHEARKTLAIMLAMLKSHELGNVRVNLP